MGRRFWGFLATGVEGAEEGLRVVVRATLGLWRVAHIRGQTFPDEPVGHIADQRHIGLEGKVVIRRRGRTGRIGGRRSRRRPGRQERVPEAHPEVKRDICPV